MSTTTTRTRNNAGSNEEKDIKAIVDAIHNRTETGLKFIQSFKEKFQLDILDASHRKGNRGVHYDFKILVGPEPGVWKHVEHKGSQQYTPIPENQTPWAAGVQFHNGGCEKYTIAKIYAKTWYDVYVGSGVLKTEWNLQSSIPTFEEWFLQDAKSQGNPKTAFGKELRTAVKKARNGKGLREERQLVNEAFQPTEEDLSLFKQELIGILNSVLSDKHYWLTIHGDVTGNFHCAWYPNFTISTIEKVTIRKEQDIWFDFKCASKNFTCILRWGKGAGFSNIRIDAR